MVRSLLAEPEDAARLPSVNLIREPS